MLSFVGLILSVCTVQVAALHHSSWSSPSSKWHDSLLHSPIIFLHFFTFSFPSLHHSSSIFLCSFFSSFTIRFTYYSCFLLFFLNYHHLILCFSLCPLEVNLHTFLTTWLSSCVVGIFFGFLTIIVKKNL